MKRVSLRTFSSLLISASAMKGQSPRCLLYPSHHSCSTSTTILYCSSVRYFSIVPVTMPALSPTMEAGKISEWSKKIGEEVESGDCLCRVETDKATVPFNASTEEGFLARYIQEAGAGMVKVGDVIALLVDEKEGLGSKEVKEWTAPAARGDGGTSSTAAAAKQEDDTKAGSKKPTNANAMMKDDEFQAILARSGPAVQRLAAQLGDTAKSARPSGKGGRFVKADFASITEIDYSAAATMTAVGKDSPASSSTTAPTPKPKPTEAADSQKGQQQQQVSKPNATAASTVSPGAVYNYAARDDIVIAQLVGKKVAKKVKITPGTATKKEAAETAV